MSIVAIQFSKNFSCFEGAFYLSLFLPVNLFFQILSVIFFSFESFKMIGGGNRDRTCDPLLAKQVLSQLSYAPKNVRKWCGFE